MGGAGGWADAAAGGSARQRSGERVGDARAAARTLAGPLARWPADPRPSVSQPADRCEKRPRTILA